MTLSARPSAKPNRITCSMPQLIKAARGLLVDLDGTLIQSDAAIPGASEFLKQYGEKVIILTNNSSDTPATLAANMQRLGLSCEPSRIILAGTETVATVAKHWPRARVNVRAAPAIIDAARACGLIITQDVPDVVIIARDVTFDYVALRLAANAIRRGATFVVCNPDRVHPGDNNTVVPETGALAASVIAASGKQPDLVIGKPHPQMYLAAMERLGVSAEEAVMVGDNAETDGHGAEQLGMAFCQVGAGITVADLL